ncbi:Phenylacetic acid catabolic protein [Lentibacillus salinarum]|uniref:Phenylacetic acid catabolic protein n=1 Tax=Lentibacillus salinarum TaxID=446820 RepID=A0ABW3ZR30_9BACI
MVNTENDVLIELLETIADNKFIMGDHLVEIGVSGPNLEASLSSVAMAQSELGHARLLYNWVEELKHGKKRKIEIKNQTGKAFSTAMDTEDWISLIASLFITNATSKVILDVVANSPYSTKTITKMVKEQKDNITYARSWCNQLANDKGNVPVKFQRDFNEAKKEAYDWLLYWENDDRLRHLEIIEKNTSLIELFNEEINSISFNEDVVYAK